MWIVNKRLEKNVVFNHMLPLVQAPIPARRLNPVFQIDEAPHLLATQFLAAVPRTLLRRPVTNLADQNHNIMAALDFALTGF